MQLQQAITAQQQPPPQQNPPLPPGPPNPPPVQIAPPTQGPGPQLPPVKPHKPDHFNGSNSTVLDTFLVQLAIHFDAYSFRAFRELRIPRNPGNLVSRSRRRKTTRTRLFPLRKNVVFRNLVRKNLARPSHRRMLRRVPKNKVLR